MEVASWWDAAAGPILGWTLVHTLWQAGVVAAGLALLLWVLPESMVRLRAVAASGSLALVVVLCVSTWSILEADWENHRACRASGSFARAHPALCASHGIAPESSPGRIQRESAGAAGVPRVSTLEWLRRQATPLPHTAGSLALAATGPVSLVPPLWAALALVFLLRLLLAHRLLRRTVDRSGPAQGAGLGEIVGELGTRLGIDRSIEVRESTAIPVPAVAGGRRPVILLPRGVTDALGRGELSALLAHELVHVRERHFVRNLGQCALDCLLVCNPFALWISRRIREEREAYCDRVAVRAMRCGATTYVEALLELERLRAPAGAALVGFLGEMPLLRRIRRLIDSGRAVGRGGRSRRAAAAALITLPGLLLVAQLCVSAAFVTSWAVMVRSDDRQEVVATSTVADERARSRN